MINNKLQIFGAWSGLLFTAILGIGWGLIPGFIPPFDPGTAGPEVAAYFVENSIHIRIGMIMAMFGAMLIMPFSASIALEIKEIEGGTGMLTLLQIMGGLCLTILVFYPPLWWVLASFRPERSAELVLLINDAAWLQFVGGVSIMFPSLLTVAAAAFMDKREQPVFPRWVGYLSIWMSMLILPSQLIFFFTRGPFAWDGIIGFWLGAIALVAWILTVCYHIRKAAILRMNKDIKP